MYLQPAGYQNNGSVLSMGVFCLFVERKTDQQMMHYVVEELMSDLFHLFSMKQSHRKCVLNLNKALTSFFM